uniref:Prokineticin domain-containing protein n=1 Tax=Tetranychus urticae TaxID=32264 RepID=T1JUA6_TETUR
MNLSYVCFLLMYFVFFIIGSASSQNCYSNPEACQKGECCVKVQTIVGKCKKLKEVNNYCNIKSIGEMGKKHVYQGACPCQEGLECVAKDGIVGEVMGTCKKINDTD